MLHGCNKHASEGRVTFSPCARTPPPGGRGAFKGSSASLRFRGLAWMRLCAAVSRSQPASLPHSTPGDLHAFSEHKRLQCVCERAHPRCCFFLLPHHVLHFKQHHETVMYPLCLTGLHQWTIAHHFCTEVDVLVSNVRNGSIINIKQVRVFLRKVAGSFCLHTNTGPTAEQMRQHGCVVGLSLDLKCALAVARTSVSSSNP